MLNERLRDKSASPVLRAAFEVHLWLLGLEVFLEDGFQGPDNRRQTLKQIDTKAYRRFPSVLNFQSVESLLQPRNLYSKDTDYLTETRPRKKAHFVNAGVCKRRSRRL